MPLHVERLWDTKTLEIKLQSPQGDSFIHANKQADGFYDLCVILPWYEQRDYFDPGGVSWDEKFSEEEVLSIYESPTYELIAIIRRTLPAFKRLSRDNDLDT